MGSVIDKLLRHPVVSSVVAAAIVAVFSKLLGWWPSISDALKVSWEFITKPVAIPVWLLTLFILITSGLFLIIFLLRRSVNNETDFMLDYREDEVYGIKWRWGYFSDGSLKDPIPFCVNCDFQLVPQFDSAFHAIDRWSFNCDNCGHKPPMVEEPLENFENRVRRQIQLRIRSRDQDNKVVT